MIKDTNPYHYKVDGANFIEYMNDPKIAGFGNWMFANGYNSGVWASSNWISVKDRLPELDTNVLWCAKYEPERVNAIRYSNRKWDIRISAFTGCINHGIPCVESYGDACVPLYWMPIPKGPKEVIED